MVSRDDRSTTAANLLESGWDILWRRWLCRISLCSLCGGQGCGLAHQRQQADLGLSSQCTTLVNSFAPDTNVMLLSNQGYLDAVSGVAHFRGLVSLEMRERERASSAPASCKVLFSIRLNLSLVHYD